MKVFYLFFFQLGGDSGSGLHETKSHNDSLIQAQIKTVVDTTDGCTSVSQPNKQGKVDRFIVTIYKLVTS